VASGMASAVCKGEDATQLLTRTARAYSEMTTLQVEAEAETNKLVAATNVDLKVPTPIYYAPPNRTSIEIRNSDGSVQTILLSDGTSVIEYHGWDGTVTRSKAALDIHFNPERGLGMGEMTPDLCTGRQLGAPLTLTAEAARCWLR
jgi:hypothetical protein